MNMRNIVKVGLYAIAQVMLIIVGVIIPVDTFDFGNRHSSK